MDGILITSRVGFAIWGTLQLWSRQINFSGEVGKNLAVGLVTSCCVCQTASWRHACCWLGEGPWALVTPVKVIRVGVELVCPNYANSLNTWSDTSKLAIILAPQVAAKQFYSIIPWLCCCFNINCWRSWICFTWSWAISRCWSITLYNVIKSINIPSLT